MVPKVGTKNEPSWHVIFTQWDKIISKGTIPQRTEVVFDSFLYGGFTTMAVINPPERKMAKFCPRSY